LIWLILYFPTYAGLIIFTILTIIFLVQTHYSNEFLRKNLCFLLPVVSNRLLCSFLVSIFHDAQNTVVKTRQSSTSSLRVTNTTSQNSHSTSLLFSVASKTFSKFT
jgi:hypothetical protein